MVDSAPSDPRPGSLAELRASARGWHGVQLAVLGFIGLCGVLVDGSPSRPMWLQTLAGILVLSALLLACVATFLVGRAAWPVYRATASASAADEPEALRRASRDLTRGLLLTFVAVAVLALGAASAWWPEDEAQAGALVEARATTGESWCGRLADAETGTVRIASDQGPVVVELRSLAVLRAVDNCG